MGTNGVNSFGSLMHVWRFNLTRLMLAHLAGYIETDIIAMERGLAYLETEADVIALANALRCGPTKIQLLLEAYHWEKQHRAPDSYHCCPRTPTIYE